MLKKTIRRMVAPVVSLAALAFVPRTHSQARLPDGQDAKPESPRATSLGTDGWGRPITALSKDAKSAPAPKRDLSGIWDSGLNGNQVLGAQAVPDDGKPGHELPLTPAGLEALNRTKPASGFRSTVPTENNDPVLVYGDPQGFPREDLYELRAVQIVQTPESVLLLYQFGRVWRIIWTDGREVPRNPEPRWFGYSVGKWVDDYTLVVETSGMDERTWIDKAGRPHSAALRVEERFHRVDRDHLELSMTISDPKMYTKPWVALDRIPLELQPRSFDIQEMIWAPSEFQEYNKLVGDAVSDKDSH